MEMRKSSSKGQEVKHESEKGKRIYRAALECVCQLDELLTGKKGYRDAFLPETIGLRNRLKDYCERLIFLEPVEYGRRAEELLWRKVFYDIIQLTKPSRKQSQNNSGLDCAVRTHLSAAAGYYHHLLLRLQSEYDLTLDGMVDLFLMPELKSCKKPHQLKKRDIDPAILEWASRACHRCLICLGDIARYQSEFDNHRGRMLARRYYYQALNMRPDIGMPHNQLGTLVGTAHYNCSAAYYYMRCLMCEIPFEGAQNNLKRLFEKNRKRYAEVLSPSTDLPPDQQRFKNVKRFLVRFMFLLDVFHYNVQNLDNHDLQQCCQNALQDFNLCMYYQPQQRPSRQNFELTCGDEKLAYLDDDLVFKVVVMCMITMHNLHSVGSKSVSAAIAFSLALFSHILNHVISRIQSAVYDHKNAGRVKSEDLSPHDFSDASTDSEHKPRDLKPTNQSEAAEKAAKKKKLLQKLEKRRRRRNSGDSDLSLGSDTEEMNGKSFLQSQLSDSDSDMVDYLTDSDSSADSDPLMDSQTLKPGFNGETANERPSRSSLQQDIFTVHQPSRNPFGLAFNGVQDGSSSAVKEIDGFLKGVVEGTKQVALPPGFDDDPEARYVDEITRKIATFNIETDTETSVVTTDNEKESIVTTESDAEASSEEEEVLEDSTEAIRTLLGILTNESLLMTIKIFCDWMIGHMAIIETCAQSSHMLWSRLSVLLNLLPPREKIVNLELCETERMLRLLEPCANEDWRQTHPLSEDLHLRALPSLGVTQQKFNFVNRLSMSENQETLLRVVCLLKFGHLISKSKTIPLSYSQETKMFFGPLSSAGHKDEKHAQEKLVDNEARRNQLMRDMAQLRLQAEVHQLEGSVKQQQKPSLPPYVVVDTTGLSENLSEVKKLLSPQRFVIIVPLAVIDELDFMKKDNRRARDTIRWLELKFKKGNRYIRAQKLNEKGAQTPPKALKRKDKEKWCMLRVLDCCRYFSRQQSECNPRENVCLLTNRVNQRLKDLLKSSHLEGVTVSTVPEFARKVRNQGEPGEGDETPLHGAEPEHEDNG